jgi:signal transduction histidine kinase
MSLRRKFILLLLALGVVVAVNLGTVVWSMLFLERELAAPLGSFQEVLTGLSEAKRKLGEIHTELVGGAGGRAAPGPMIPSEPGPEPRRDDEAVRAFETRASEVLAELTRLEARESYQLRAGLSTTRNLRSRVSEALEAARLWYQTGDAAVDPSARREVIRSFYVLHELIERIEGQNLKDLGWMVVYGAELRWTMLGILAISALLFVLVVWDAVAFIGRWSIKPVARLRLAAERLAAGDFAHRIEITSRDEIGQLSGEVNHMAETIALMQAERIERERLAAVGEVVQRITHNLRNPLAGIRSLAEYTRGELAPGTDARESQERIISTVDRFEGWLAGLLSATKPMEVHLEPHDVGPWVAAVLEPHRAAAGAKGVRLEVDVQEAPPKASFDPRHLEQALVALVTNAIEASPRGGAVQVGADEQAGEPAWRLRVADEGTGVPLDLRDKIFRPYFTTKRSGSGIGLAVAHKVVTEHGGRIAVSDRSSGAGAEFTVVLPLSGTAANGQVWPKGAGGGENSGH